MSWRNREIRRADHRSQSVHRGGRTPLLAADRHRPLHWQGRQPATRTLFTNENFRRLSPYPGLWRTARPGVGSRATRASIRRASAPSVCRWTITTEAVKAARRGSTRTGDDGVQIGKSPFEITAQPRKGLGRESFVVNGLSFQKRPGSLRATSTSRARWRAISEFAWVKAENYLGAKTEAGKKYHIWRLTPAAIVMNPTGSSQQVARPAWRTRRKNHRGLDRCRDAASRPALPSHLPEGLYILEVFRERCPAFLRDPLPGGSALRRKFPGVGFPDWRDRVVSLVQPERPRLPFLPYVKNSSPLSGSHAGDSCDKRHMKPLLCLISLLLASPRHKALSC